MLAFETMLWRVSKGNVFIKFMDIEEQMIDPDSGDPAPRGRLSHSNLHYAH